MGSLCKEQFADFLLAYGFALNELLQFQQILLGIECDASALSSVAASASGFLIVAFQTLGNVVVDNESHVWLVDAHTKSDCGNNHLHIVFQKLILILRPHSTFHACMVRERLDVVHIEQFSQFFHLFSTQTVDDARFPLHAFDEADNFLIHIFGFWSHLVVKVRAVERRLEYLAIGNIEVLHNVVLNLWRGCGGERNDWSSANLLNVLSDISIFCAEIMSPLRDTVCLVYCVERNFHTSEKFDVLFLCERFGSNVEEFSFA